MAVAKTPTPTSTSSPKTAKPEKDGDKPVIKVVADNRRARHEYDIMEVYEVGIALTGTEVKSIRMGRANLSDSFARIEDGELWLFNCNISPYDHGNRFNHEPLRKRRLLMHKREIQKLRSKIQEKGLTLVPLKMFFKDNWAKLDIAVAKGRQLYDKRDAITKKDTKRQLDRLMKQSGR